MTDEVVKWSVDGRGVATLTLNRPEVRNALNGPIGEAFMSLLGNLDPSVRVIVLQGAGPVFCAGADIGYMRDATPEHALSLLAALGRMFRALDDCPVPVVGRIHGAAIAGATGLVSCCDVAVAAESTAFAFTEVRIGLVPAIISPYVMRRVGYGFARHMFLTAERFTAHRAHQVGLIDRIADDDALDDEVAKVVDMLLLAAPGALRETRRILDLAWGREPSEVEDAMISASARSRTSDEGREGIAAFFGKRPPTWAQ